MAVIAVPLVDTSHQCNVPANPHGGCGHQDGKGDEVDLIEDEQVVAVVVHWTRVVVNLIEACDLLCT